MRELFYLPDMRTTRVALAGVTSMLLAVSACGDGPSTPDETRRAPRISAIEPTSGSPLSSPMQVTIVGDALSGATVETPPGMFAEPTVAHSAGMELRLSYMGIPPGPHWISVATPFGRDSVQFSVLPLGPDAALEETRALWVSRFEWADASDIGTIMDRAEDAGFNLVYFQVRGRADAFYRSSLEPWSHMLTGELGRDPGWDPLEVAVGEAHRRGLELHAWINAFTGWAGSDPPGISEPLHAFIEHPDWVMVDQGGAPMPYGSGSRWLTPGHPDVRSRLAAVSADIARRYDVEGIHLDFIRYPDPRYSYDHPSLSAFDSARAQDATLTFDDMRRRFVTWAVAEVRDSLEAADPDGKLSAAVWGIFRNPMGWASVTTGYDDVLQDARAWDRMGLVDALAPMVYWTVGERYGARLDFAYLADDHAEALEVPTYIGIYVPPLSRVDLTTQIERARERPGRVGRAPGWSLLLAGQATLTPSAGPLIPFNG
jgi:uncharacterized lipoprotein YddW (UPF0748 family)